MDFSLVPVSRIFKTYQGQARIANLNKKSLVKRAQGQKDQVTISSEARQALQENSKVAALASLLQELKRLKVPENQPPVASGDFVPGI
jgi:hypothetical protein